MPFAVASHNRARRLAFGEVNRCTCRSFRSPWCTDRRTGGLFSLSTAERYDTLHSPDAHLYVSSDFRGSALNWRQQPVHWLFIAAQFFRSPMQPIPYRLR